MKDVHVHDNYANETIAYKIKTTILHNQTK